MAWHRNVLKEGDILCEFCVDTCSNVSDDCKNEILDSDGNIPTTSLGKQLLLLLWFLLVTVKQVWKRKVVKQVAPMVKEVLFGVKLINNQAMGLTLKPQI
jgi:hypothetical protein